MVYAEIKNKRDTLVLGFPRNAADMQLKLSSIGIHKSVKDIPLSAQGGNDIRVRLYADSNIWNHFVHMFSENDSLADVNTAVQTVMNSDEIIRTELEQNIIHDQYDSVSELLKDIEEMTVSAGKYAESFYFPLKGMLDEDEYDDCYEIDNLFLQQYKSDIQEAVEREQSIGDMAQYFNEEGSVKNKLVSAVWSLDEVDGKLYGCVKTRLKEPLNEEESKILKDWITGQNSDGLGEGFEQRSIGVEEGDLYVSFWNSGNGYFVYSQEEMDDYIHEQHEMQMGGM